MNTFGRIFRISIFGESHGESIGVIIDGCPPGIKVEECDLISDLKRRNKKHTGSTKREESDKPIIKSGFYNGFTTGAPILIEFKNDDIKSDDYFKFENHPRPGHSDFVSKVKFKGYNDLRGGGHFSGRMTLGLVAAGVIAKKITQDITFNASILSINGFEDYGEILLEMEKNGNSVGGIIECKISNLPVGLGEPFFDSIESYISHLIFSIPGIKGIEFGTGFKSSEMTGKDFNDPIINKTGKTLTNNSGGINGGLSNGNDIIFRVAVKPTSSILVEQETYNFETNSIETLKIRGRHDVCFALRLPVIIEAAASIAITDLFLINKNN